MVACRGTRYACAVRRAKAARSDTLSPRIVIGLNAVVAAVTAEAPRILTVRTTDQDALPFGRLDPGGDRTLELGLRTLVREQTGLALGYVEQLYTFGDRDRGQRTKRGDARVISVAYLALAREGRLTITGLAQWRD